MPLDAKSLKIDAGIFQHTVEKKLSDLPTLPVVVSRIMQTANNPDTTANEMQRLIAMDQGLASKILRVVNSAYYGLPKRVGTISQAVMILGYTTVRNLVMGISAFGILQQSMPYGLNRSKFWEHCVASAVASSLLAKQRLPRNRNAPDEAFLGGLLHDVGSLFLDCYFPAQHAVSMAYARRDTKSAREAECFVMGIDHAMVGRRISEHWNFPAHITAMIGLHHNPTPNHEHFDLIAITHAADWIAWQCGHFSSEYPCPPSLSQEVSDWLLFDESQWKTIKTEFHEQYRQCQQLVDMMG